MVRYGGVRKTITGEKIMGYYESYIENMGEADIKTYYYEIYTKGPKGETGWEIKTGFVKSMGVEIGKRKVRHIHWLDFDCFIQFYEVTKDCVLTK